MGSPTELQMRTFPQSVKALERRKIAKRSRCLESSPFRIVAKIDGQEARSFYVHSDLAAMESKRIEKELRGGFKESTEYKIDVDEDPQLCIHFLEYLYQPGVINSTLVQHEADYVLLARLYAIGERLHADGFQAHSLKCFLADCGPYTNIWDSTICDLLEIACDQLPDRVSPDPVKDHVYWYVAARLDNLRKFSRFLELLSERASLGKDLCLRAGNSTMSQPHKPSDPPPMRFKFED